MTDERDVELFLVLKVKALGGKAIKLVGEEGLPDRLVLFPGGKSFFCELKRPEGGVLSPAQKYIHGKLRNLGFNVYVTKNKDEVLAMLKEEKDE